MAGDNLSNYKNLEYFVAEGPKELLDLLQQIRLPHEIVSIYGYGTRHVAWVNLSTPIKKRIVSKRFKDEIKE